MVIGIAVLSGDTNRWTRPDATGTLATHAPSLGRLSQPKRPGLACPSADHCRTQPNRQVQTAPHADCRSAFLQQVEKMASLAWSMACHCGSPHCRRIVTNADWRRPDVQERYTGYCSPFLNRRIAAARHEGVSLFSGFAGLARVAL
jgi:hypothetical protein